MKKTIHLIILSIFAATAYSIQIDVKAQFPNLPEVGSKQYKEKMQEYINVLREEDTEKREYVKKLLIYKGSKEIIPILVDNLSADNMLFVMEIEVLLLRITNKGFYGVCLGNKNGINDFESWWSAEGANFKYPNSLDYYYKDYYKPGRTDEGSWFVRNAITRLWKNLKTSGMKIPKYDQEKELDAGLSKTINYLLTLLYAPNDKDRFCDNFLKKYIMEVNYFIGKPIYPLRIEFIDKGYFGEEISSAFSAIASNARIPFDEKVFYGNKAYWKEWWSKNSKKVKVEIDIEEKCSYQEIVPKITVFPAVLTEEVEGKIKSNVLLMKSINSSGGGSAELRKIGPIAIPFIVEEMKVAVDKDELFSLNHLIMDIYGFIPQDIDINLMSEKLTKEESYAKWKEWLEKHKNDYFDFFKIK